MEAVSFSITTKDAKWFAGIISSANIPIKAKPEPYKDAVNTLKQIGSDLESGVKTREQAHMDSAYRAERNRADSLQSIIDDGKDE